MVSIAGLDKAAVFAALFNGARAQGLGFLQYNPKPMTPAEAQKRFGGRFESFDYVDGRVMKIDLSGDEFDPWGYDRDNGAGAAQRVIDTLRSTGNVDHETIERQHLEGTHAAAEEVKDNLGTKTKRNGPVIELGFGDFAKQLGPKIKKFLE